MANNYHKLAVPIPCGLVNSGAEKGGPDQGATVPEPDTHTKQPVLFRTTKQYLRDEITYHVYNLHIENISIFIFI